MRNTEKPKEEIFKNLTSHFSELIILICIFPVSYANVHMCFSDYFPMSLIIALSYRGVVFNPSLCMVFIQSMNSVKLYTNFYVGTYVFSSHEGSWQLSSYTQKGV